MESAREIITGVGLLYLAEVGTAFPDVDDTPDAGDWYCLGETLDGVKVTQERRNEMFGTDQRTGKVKAVATEEGVTIETKVAQGTLENLAKIKGNTVTDTAPGAGSIGTREVNLHVGATVTEYALLFRGTGQSPYGDYNAQYQVPRGFIEGQVEAEYKKDGQSTYTLTFRALEDLDAATEDEAFGQLITQDSDALAP